MDMDMDRAGSTGRIPKLLDTRTEFREMGVNLVSAAMAKHWPSVPGRDSTAEEAAVDCMTILARIHWSRKGRIVPEPQEDEDAFVRYIWTLFDESTHVRYGDLRDSARYKAVTIFRMELGAGFTFDALCRSKKMVESLWKSPENQLTWPEMVRGPDCPPGGKLGCHESELASKGFLEWDGVECPSLEDLTARVTRETRLEDGNTVHVFFRGPSILEVRFSPGPGCEYSLRDVWQFSADAWAYHNIGESAAELRPRGKQAYTLMAIVKHRDTPQGGDCIRVFTIEGREQVSSTHGRAAMPDWGFGVEDRIPGGVKLSLFYTAIPHLSSELVLTEAKVVDNALHNLMLDVRKFNRLFLQQEDAPGKPGKPGSSQPGEGGTQSAVPSTSGTGSANIPGPSRKRMRSPGSEASPPRPVTIPTGPRSQRVNHYWDDNSWHDNSWNDITTRGRSSERGRSAGGMRGGRNGSRRRG